MHANFFNVVNNNMYISCPNCATKFTIKTQQIGLGRHVRCSKCGYAWHFQQNSNSTDISVADKVTAVKKTNHLPALIPDKKSNKILLFLILFSSLALLTLTLQKFEYFRHLWHYNKELKIERIVILKNESNNLIVRYTIKHDNFVPFALPLMRIRLLDENFKVIDTHISNTISDATIHDGSVDIETEFFDAPLETYYVDVTIGGYFDFIFR
jgi:predicted Zn finger-like uncharacterized protein